MDTPIVIKTQEAQVQKGSNLRQGWLRTVKCCTCLIPSCCLRSLDQRQQIAWREKITLMGLILLINASFLMYIIGIGLLLCPRSDAISEGQLDGLRSIGKPYVAIYGFYYKIDSIAQDHVFAKQYLNKEAMEQTVLGRDVSAMFYKDSFQVLCPGLEAPSQDWDPLIRNIPKEALKVWMIHDDKDKTGKRKNYLKSLQSMIKGPLARDNEWSMRFLEQDQTRNRLLIAYGNVYDVSAYLDPVQQPKFLGPNIAKIIESLGTSGKDVTSYFEQIRQLEGQAKWKQYKTCMDNLFFTGVVDKRNSKQCQIINLILLVSSLLVIGIVSCKFLAALQFNTPQHPEPQDRFVICAIPCFNESRESLQECVHSLISSTYCHERMLLFIVVDGLVTGSGNDKPTSDIVLDMFQVQDQDSPTRLYHAMGDGSLQLNAAKVYSGIYQHKTSIPFVIVIKIGNHTERFRPGNRGKRDSQLILMHFLSRVHQDEPMSPLELELLYHMRHKLGIEPTKYEYLFQIDGDTLVQPQSLSCLVSTMQRDTLIAGLCGETKIRNETASWVTMIQVYDYFVSHHLSKSFESLFNSVTCLPGCFCIYRIFTANERKLLVCSKNVVKAYGERNTDTLHLKNLLALGEDRYLTTLMMKHFPQMKLKFNADAQALTSVPEQWSVLMSQRRRWINSTFHNLAELLLVRNLCGCFVFSLRFVILIDLLTTILGPAGFVYIVWLAIELGLDATGLYSQIPIMTLVMLGSVYGLQIILFILKRQWQHIGWMFVYLFSMPLYSFYLPLYSFWHFDDFSWGSTRLVDNDGHVITDREFEQDWIPHKRWSAFVDQDLDWRQTLDAK
ncbi:glycosyltransferase family 2 protein [Gorgonomyces haynaldii]|nr:glycosyltransferase family 2 protein [Gorgonomyces haynaldii]